MLMLPSAVAAVSGFIICHKTKNRYRVSAVILNIVGYLFFIAGLGTLVISVLMVTAILPERDRFIAEAHQAAQIQGITKDLVINGFDLNIERPNCSIPVELSETNQLVASGLSPGLVLTADNVTALCSIITQ